MLSCPACDSHLVRVRRSLLQRLVFRAFYRCAECNTRVSRPRAFLAIFRPYAQCPRCDTRDLSRLAVKDKIDRTSSNPIRRMLKLLGCPLYHCTFCRMQFRDWRKLAPNSRRYRTSGAPRAQVFSD